MFYDSNVPGNFPPTPVSPRNRYVLVDQFFSTAKPKDTILDTDLCHENGSKESMDYFVVG